MATTRPGTIIQSWTISRSNNGYFITPATGPERNWQYDQIYTFESMATAMEFLRANFAALEVEEHK